MYQKYLDILEKFNLQDNYSKEQTNMQNLKKLFKNSLILKRYMEI